MCAGARPQSPHKMSQHLVQSVYTVYVRIQIDREVHTFSNGRLVAPLQYIDS